MLSQQQSLYTYIQDWCYYGNQMVLAEASALYYQSKVLKFFLKD